MKTTAHSIAAALALAAAALAPAQSFADDAATVLYANDFSARTGASAVPSGRWRGYDYQIGTVAYNYPNSTGGAYTWSDGLAWADPSKSQDGWVLSGNGTWAAGVTVSTNSAAERPGDTDRPFLAFGINNANFYRSRAYQPIGNSFTNGVVEYWVDMRAPGKWGSTSSTPYFRFFPVYRTYLQLPDNTVNEATAYPGKFGPMYLSSKTKARFYGGSSYNGSAGIVGDGDGGDFELDPGRWYRFRMVVNFETHWCIYSAWALGEEVPTWDSAVGARLVNSAGKYIYRDITDEIGPLDGIGFEVGGINSGNPSVVTNMPAATNIRIGWKASDADTAFIPCYSNDFQTCWRRSLAAATASHAYAAPSGTGVSAFSSYYVNSASTIPGSRIVSNASGSGWQSIGMDGWKRIHHQGNAYPSVAASGEAGGNVLRVTQGNSSANGTSIYYGVLGNTLGETISSGKVVLEADVRTPDKWYWDTSRMLDVALADDYAYTNATGSDFGTHVLSRFGFTSSDNTAAPYIRHLADTSLSSDTATTGAFSTWYRVRIEADLDAKTSAYTLWSLGSSGNAADYEPTDAPVATKSGAIRSTLSEVSTVVLYAYAVGSTAAGAAMFDNIKVWKVPTGGATTNLIYSNDFSVRRRCNAAATAELADAPNVVAAERDCWTRRGGSVSGPALLASSGNACLAMEAQEANPVCAVQDMGALAAKAKEVEVRVDLRPPSIWSANTASKAFFKVLLGGDALHSAATFGGAAPADHARIAFGFSPAGSTALSLQRLTAVTAVAGDGATDTALGFTVDATHWYRFVAKAVSDSAKWSLAVYDQGTSHPASSDANGTLVASLSDLAQANTTDTGKLSTLGFYGSGIAGTSPTVADDPSLGLADNVVVTKIPAAFVLTIR